MPMINDHIRALKDESPLVRQVAAPALGKIGDPKAVEPLTSPASKGETEAVRKTVAEALGKLARSQTI